MGVVSRTLLTKVSLTSSATRTFSKVTAVVVKRSRKIVRSATQLERVARVRPLDAKLEVVWREMVR